MQKPGVEILYLVFAADTTGKLRSATARKSKTLFHHETHNLHKIQEKEEKQKEKFSCVSWLGRKASEVHMVKQSLRLQRRIDPFKLDYTLQNKTVRL